MAKGSFFGLFGSKPKSNQESKPEAEEKADDKAKQNEEEQASAPAETKQVEPEQPQSEPQQSQPKPTEAETPPESDPQPEQEPESVAAALAPDAAEVCAQVTAEVAAREAPAKRPTRKGLWSRLTDGLRKTSDSIGEGLFGLFRDKQIDDELFEDLETQLLTADLGVPTTTRIVKRLTQQANRKQLKDAEALYELLQEDMAEILAPVDRPLVIPTQDGPFVILMVGVNGVGKTTTIGKLAQQFKREGKSVMLAAGDTFRAAAVEQLQVWGERNDIPVIAQHTGADSASVIYDAVEAAKARNVDVLIADTAGRLQNKAHLMDELKKVVRVMKKLDVNAPHEVMLTLDAGTGQNAISQTKLFTEAVGITGITLTKLDGTAKGGIIFAIADQFAIPIRYIGVGEGLEDLRPFVAKEFVNALFRRDQQQQ
ncbi:signal recognition particle-docking protein FtsY [Pseudidiomarina planktonica]|uniref:Signal recognition particle receptor FtsY n=1 Tax=Pseudidiomarina planktonica TaxID=1323738 RepID=A0A1Y6EAA6_9GAMM|nr:signal recognition particle-docking protein FtsY [Pseudidiomarina planktonica]RUO66232.1 signal recognition particle-docking protein FtsY [Pseudidiomarina planktonica]SMQ59517.1 signal recognition particle-docking protein FtsY [Pseudidiomarina planktonica]